MYIVGLTIKKCLWPLDHVFTGHSIIYSLYVEWKDAVIILYWKLN